MTTFPDWTTYSDEDLVAAGAQIVSEQSRRYTLATLPEQMVAMNKTYLDLSGTAPGEPWVQPTGAHDAYPKDWIVTHLENTWRSLVDANVWEPGIANWAIVSDEEYPPWVQPTGSGDAYPAGAKVSHAGAHWVSAIDANVWEPGAPGSEALWIEQTTPDTTVPTP